MSKKKAPAKPRANKLAIVTSDLHLAPRTWLSRPQLVGDSYFALRQIIELSIEHEAPAIIAAGDLINVRRPDPLTINVLREAMDQCQANRIEFHYVQGQHEMSDPPWLGAVHRHPRWLGGAQLRHDDNNRVCDLELCGLDYQSPDKLAEALRTLPKKCDIVVLHQLWREFAPPPMNSDGSLEDVPSGRLIVTGDYHQHLTCELSGDRLALSPGSTCLQSIEEQLPKQVFLIDTNLEVESLALRTRSCWRPRPLTNDEDLEKFLVAVDDQLEVLWGAAQDLPKELRTPIVRVAFDAEIPRALPRIQAKLADRAVLFAKPTWPEVDPRTLTRSTRDEALAAGHEGALGLLLEDTDSSAYQAAQRLIRAGDEPWKELIAMRKEVGLG